MMGRWCYKQPYLLVHSNKHCEILVVIVPFFFFSALEPGEAPNNSPSILAMLETLQNAPYLDVHKDMIRWILKVQFLASLCFSWETFSVCYL